MSKPKSVGRNATQPTTANLSGARALDGVYEKTPPIPVVDPGANWRSAASAGITDHVPPAHLAPVLNRRSMLMNTIVSAASVATASAVNRETTATASALLAAVPASTDDRSPDAAPGMVLMSPVAADDAALLALAREALTLNRRYDEAIAKHDDLFKEYVARSPDRPSALRWRLTDPVGFSKEPVEGDRYRLWCCEEDIEAHRNKPVTRLDFIGTQKEWEALPTDAEASNNMKHLWELVPEPRRQQRLYEITAAFDQHKRQLKAIRHALGIDAAKICADELLHKLTDIENEIESTRALTVAGFQAKAIVIAHACWNGKISRGGGSLENRLTASLVRDLTGLPDDEQSTDAETDDEV